MVKRGYRVIQAPEAGLADWPLSEVVRLAAADLEISNFGYLGVEMTYTSEEKQTNAQTDVQTDEQMKKETLDQSIEYIPTQAFQQICTEYSQMSSSSSSDMSSWESLPNLSSSRLCLHSENMIAKVPAGSNTTLISQISTHKLADIDFISADIGGYETAWSDLSESEYFHSVLSSNISAEHEAVDNEINKYCSDETPEFGYFGFNSDKVQVESDVDESDEVNSECNSQIMKVRTMNDLNNESHYSRRQNAESLNSIRGNIFEIDVEDKENHSEQRENNMPSPVDSDSKIANENLANSKKSRGRKRTSSIDLILDMQKYVINKENVCDDNCDNNTKWNVKCLDCKTSNENSQLELSDSFPGDLPRYPLDDFYKKRQNVTSKTNRNITGYLLCGCAKLKTSGQKKRGQATRHTKKFDGRLGTAGFKWKF